jgi:hypothetical protein
MHMWTDNHSWGSRSSTWPGFIDPQIIPIAQQRKWTRPISPVLSCLARISSHHNATVLEPQKHSHEQRRTTKKSIPAFCCIVDHVEQRRSPSTMSSQIPNPCSCNDYLSNKPRHTPLPPARGDHYSIKVSRQPCLQSETKGKLPRELHPTRQTSQTPKPPSHHRNLNLNRKMSHYRTPKMHRTSS